MHLQDLLVLLRLVHLQVREKFAAASNHAEQTLAGAVIFLVVLQVLRKEVDLLCKKADLNLRGSRVLRVGAVLLDKFLLGGALQWHRSGGKETSKEDAGPQGRKSSPEARTVRRFYGSAFKNGGLSTKEWTKKWTFVHLLLRIGLAI